MPRLRTALARAPGGRGGFGLWLGLIVLAAAGLRFWYVRTLAPGTPDLSDGPWFRDVSDHLVHGHGFTLEMSHVFVPTATHPPLYPLWLALFRVLGANSDLALRSTGTLLGAATVCLVGILGRRIGGFGLGLCAAAIVAVHPLLIAADGSLFGETLYSVTIAAVLLTGWLLHESPTWPRAAALGASVGLAALTRSEALLLLVLVAVPLVWRLPGRVRWRLLGSAAALTLLVLAPWVVRNWSEVGRPVLSNNYGNLIGATNNHATYYEAAHLGALGQFCLTPLGRDETQTADFCARVGGHYAVHHPVRWPVVVPVRVMRQWSLWDPFAHYSSDAGRDLVVEHTGIVFDYLLILLAVPGALGLRRTPGALALLAAPIILVTLVAAATYGSVRLREAAELPLAVLAAAGVLAIAARVRAARPADA